MANPGGVGTKFVSVNLNKSYGPVSNRNPTYGSSSYGQAAANRARPGSGGGGSSGGGMVVLSRPKSSQKPGPKLSVPPPLNLPSLRKENERFDLSGSGVGSASGAGSSNIMRPGSSGVGWTKPIPVAVQDTGGNSGAVDKFDQSLIAVDGVIKGGSAYMPPSARLGAAELPASVPASADKAAVLRGEDFPSLKAALPCGTSGLVQKQKNATHQKQKELSAEESANEQLDRPSSGSQVHMLTPRQSFHHTYGNRSNENGEIYGSGSQMAGQARKEEEFFPGPLPLVRVSPRSDWADDERDTGHGFVDRSRDHSYSNGEVYWDRGFDMPRNRFLPHKPVDNPRWGKRDDEIGKTCRNEVLKLDVRTSSWEGNSWRTSPLSKDGYDTQEVANGRNVVGGRTTDLSREVGKENKYMPPLVGDYPRDLSVNQQIVSGKGDAFGQEGRYQRYHTVESSNSRETDRDTLEFHGNNHSNRDNHCGPQKSSISKSLFSSSVNGSMLNGGLEKHALSNGERPSPIDAFLGPASFDEQYPFSNGLAGVIKRKKDVVKQSDFHDPVRESFEAELERVQKMQEQERQRVLEEQERALEQARREEEERRRLIREEEEQRRRVEEAAREAAWRAEQEHLEVIRRAEEQKRAREEEKQHMLMEEERRKQAAKQKLLELEARMAKRQTETAEGNSHSATTSDKVTAVVMEKDVLRVADFDSWEDSERMVDRKMTPGSSDSSGLNRSFEFVHQSQSSRDKASGFVDKVKPSSPWRRDVFESGNKSPFLLQGQDNDYQSPRRDVGRAFAKKEFHGGAGYMSSRNQYRGGSLEIHPEDYLHRRGHKWNTSGDVDPCSRSMEIDPEFQENYSENYGYDGWRQGHLRGNHSPYPERLSSDGDQLYPYGRSRYSMRQPRVPPPPSLVPMQKNSFTEEDEHPGPSTMPYNNSSGNESTMLTGYYSGQQERLEAPEIIAMQRQDALTLEQMDKNTTARCDSQSSLSVSSPPSSPTHLSHDDLDESGDSPVVSATEGKVLPIEGSESAFPDMISTKDTVVAGPGLISDADEDWPPENNDELQEQEEYDEDEDGYQEEDEVHEGDDENIVLTQEFDDLHIAEESLHMMEKLVLGFDEGADVGLPGDQFDESSKDKESAFVGQGGPVDEKQDDQCLQHLDRSLDEIDSSSRCIQEADKAIPDSVIHPISTDPHTVPESDLLETVDRSSCSISGLHTNPSAANIPSHSSSDQTVMSTIPVGSSPIELPINLQFGLFSGPPLIPSPVPSIQIGSIQMPLHLHPSVNPSLTQVHQSQPPLFQFGQLRYTAPISQGIVPMAPRLSFVQPNVLIHYNLHQSSEDCLPFQPKLESLTSNKVNCDVSPSSMDGGSMTQKIVPVVANEKKIMSEAGEKEFENSGLENHIPSDGTVSKEFVHSEESRALKTPGVKSKRYAYVARNSSTSSSFPAPEASRSHSGGFQRRSRRTVQRTEFRVREHADNKSSLSGKDVGVFVRSWSKKGSMANKTAERVVEPEPSATVQQTNTNSSGDGKTEEESSKRIRNEPCPVEATLKNNVGGDDDVDAPLQSGVVRVFKQPGIEAPSDEDDFIEVRSKRQMLNDRREQREKEMKAKSQILKAPRKRGSIAPAGVISRCSNTTSIPLGGEEPKNNKPDVMPEGRGLTSNGGSMGFASAVAQPLAPIGTPAVTSDAQADKRPHIIKSIQTGVSSVPSDSGKDLGPGHDFETKNKILDDDHTSLGSWGNSDINQQVMSLTQTQLDEAMRPGCCDVHVISTGGIGSAVVNAIMTSSSILAEDKSFPLTASPVNSLLAGEKIQFGAVTSPTVLPPSSRSVSHGIRAPGPSRSDIPISHVLSASESDCTLLFEKSKHQSESCAHLGDSEAEAEAAASAVAVAAIGGDESVGSERGVCPVSVSDTKSFRGADINGVAGGVTVDQQLSNQSRIEESLSVALPADLSIETPPMSLWPPLPSPQNSSGPMLSHFPGGPSSPFPFYEMSPMLGAPIFAFGPQDESVKTQSQPQKSGVSGSGPLAAWQQFHSSPDSFYGAPARFPGPYIGPHGSIPGVQGPPRMVVYNHFPVGQYGQVGLSFMGTSYLPSGKQPDWKHSHATSAVSNHEGDINDIKMGPGQCNPPNVASSVQHLAPPSQLLTMPSPLALFELSPFQSTPDSSVQGRWLHAPSSPLNSVPHSVPLQQQETSVFNPQINHGHPPVDQLLTANMFPEPQTSTPDVSHTLPIATDSTATQFSDELELVNSSGSSPAVVSTQSLLRSSFSGSSSIPKPAGAKNTGHSMNSFKSRSPPQKSMSSQQQYNSRSTGYGYQRSRMGFHGRNSSMGMEKSFSAKKKQIYVAKQPPSGNSAIG